MRLEPFNHCRQMVKQFSERIAIPNFPAQNRQILGHAIDLAQSSEKFLLPDRGMLFDDPEYKGLEALREVRLPYPQIAMEYRRDGPTEDGKARSSKAIVFARERDDHIVVMVIAWADHHGMWAPFPEFAIAKSNAVERNSKIDGRFGIRLHSANNAAFAEDCTQEVVALMSLLNVLACSNVHTERLLPKKERVRRDALPFDSYHVLMVGGSNSNASSSTIDDRRSPREHLRRGHIRRLSDERRIWINATVVSTGSRGGVVKKEYRVTS